MSNDIVPFHKDMDKMSLGLLTGFKTLWNHGTSLLSPPRMLKGGLNGEVTIIVR